MKINLTKNKKSSKKILVISHFYFPDARVGAKRFGNLVEGFAPYFKQVHIVSLKRKHIPSIDDSLIPHGEPHLAGMFPKYPLKKTSWFRRLLSRYWEKFFCISDPFSGWIPFATLKSLYVVFSKKIDVIIATGPPFSAMITGILVKMFTGKALILDYRDPWSNGNIKFPKPLGNQWNYLFEKIGNVLADRIVFCSQIMLDNYLEHFGQGRVESCHVLTNGYKDNKAAISGTSISLNKNKFNLLYAGNFYGGRSLSLIAAPLRKLKDQKILSEGNFKFSIFGNLQAKDKKIILDYQISDLFEISPPIAYDEVLNKMCMADSLFLPSGGDVPYAIPFKFFDYLKARKPIFAIAAENSSIDIIMREIACGVFCKTGDHEAIENSIISLVNKSIAPDFIGASNYTWSKITAAYIRLIESI